MIDGDNYPFREEYVRQSANGDGGRIAAGRLWAALTERLSSMDLPVETKVVVKYIVNLSAASVEMHKLGVIGSHSRALAPFAAAFGKEHTLFDVVDSGDLPRATDSKMQGRSKSLDLNVTDTVSRQLPPLHRKPFVQAHLLCWLQLCRQCQHDHSLRTPARTPHPDP